MRLLLPCAFGVAGAVVVVRGCPAVVGAVRGVAGLVAHDRGGRWDPVVTIGCTYLTVGWLGLRGVLIAGLGPVIRAGAGLAKWAALEKCGMAKEPPPLPGGFARTAGVRVMHTVVMKAAKIDVFI